MSIIHLRTDQLNIAELIASKHNDDGLLGLALDIQFLISVSNSHSCPRGGVTNWGSRDKDRPTGYPGWRGRVWLLYRNDKSTRISPFFSVNAPASGLHTGTGGYGLYDGTEWNYDFGYPCGYDCEIFESDHPEIEKTFNIRETLEIEAFDNKLRNSYQAPTRYRQKSVYKHPDLIEFQLGQKATNGLS
jgi:hypothetical protein